MNIEAVLKAFSDALVVAQKHTSPSGTPSSPYVHGPGGIFGVAGLERPVIHTRLEPIGLASILPARGSVDTSPLYPYISGFRDVSGSNPTNVCDDGKVAGPMKGCLQTAPFGRQTFMTREVDLTRIGQRINRGEMFDLTLVNSPLATKLGAMFPGIPSESRALAGAEVLQRFIEVGIAFQNWLVSTIWTGTTTNNTGGGGYKEFNGLDLLIGTGKSDAITDIACPSLDSIVWDYNLTHIGDEDADPNIVMLMTNIYRRLKKIAIRTRMAPIEFAIVMRDDLFWVLTDYWPCVYYTNRCQSVGDGAGTMNLPDMTRLRDDMRNNQYLMIDGEKVRVVLDDGISESSSEDEQELPAGCFASNIYFVPLRARNMDLLYWEYYDYSASNGTMQAIVDGRVSSYFWTDGGLYLWHAKPPLNVCAQWISFMEPRLRLMTPHLAARIEDVAYCPLAHSRSTLPTDDYWVDGGVTERATDFFYHESN